MTVDFTTAIDEKEPIKTIASISTNFVEVIYPDPVKRITISHPTKKLYLSFSYEDGDSGTATNSAICAAGQYFSMSVPDGLDRCQIASATGTATTVIFIMEVF